MVRWSRKEGRRGICWWRGGGHENFCTKRHGLTGPHASKMPVKNAGRKMYGNVINLRPIVATKPVLNL
jgi:hypothetical protein